jgi:hypothetical protein
MSHQKFDENASYFPYPFVGAIARSDPRVLALTIDKMAAVASNVPWEEALRVWGLPRKSHDALKSHSATDVSECAFKHFGGDLKRFRDVVGAEAWEAWEESASGVRESVAGLIVNLEAGYAGRETRRIDLTHALYHLGKASDAEGSVRTAMLYKSTLVASKAGKHFIETGNALAGGPTTADEAAKEAAKKESGKRKRQAPVVAKADQHNVRYTMLVSQLQAKGLELDDSDEERAFIEKGPTSLNKLMAVIGDIVHKRSLAERA